MAAQLDKRRPDATTSASQVGKGLGGVDAELVGAGIGTGVGAGIGTGVGGVSAELIGCEQSHCFPKPCEYVQSLVQLCPLLEVECGCPKAEVRNHKNGGG